MLIMYDIMLDRLIEIMEPPEESEAFEAVCQPLEHSVVTTVNAL